MRRPSPLRRNSHGRHPECKGRDHSRRNHVRGGRGGHLWDIVKKALETPEEQKRPDDRRVIFFPWQDDPAYCDAQPQTLTEKTVRYFEDKPGFSHNQKSWYQRARAQYGRSIKGSSRRCLRGASKHRWKGQSTRRSLTGYVQRELSALGCRQFKPRPHRLGSWQSTQHGSGIFPDRRRRDSRDRLC